MQHLDLSQPLDAPQLFGSSRFPSSMRPSILSVRAFSSSTHTALSACTSSCSTPLSCRAFLSHLPPFSRFIHLNPFPSHSSPMLPPFLSSPTPPRPSGGLIGGNTLLRPPLSLRPTPLPHSPIRLHPPPLPPRAHLPLCSPPPCPPLSPCIPLPTLLHHPFSPIPITITIPITNTIAIPIAITTTKPITGPVSTITLPPSPHPLLAPPAPPIAPSSGPASARTAPLLPLPPPPRLPPSHPAHHSPSRTRVQKERGRAGERERGGSGVGSMGAIPHGWIRCITRDAWW
ncbi:unnamed protein product [Closterium sp. NIES-54]